MKKLIAILALVGLVTFAAQGPRLHNITLAWDPNPDGPVKGFIIYWGVATGSYLWSTNVNWCTNFTLASDTFKAGTTYYYAVTSYDTNNVESDFSNEVTNIFKRFPPTLSKTGQL